MKSAEISDRFIHYYEDRGFEVLPGSSLLDPSIPMTFVMSAGLVQVETSLDRFDHSNGDAFVLCQRCFRHFDLDSIGKSDVHLSLFEMPAAFAFGVNGRSAVIERMWGLATEALEIDPSRLWATYFAGGMKGGHEFLPDIETYRAWRQIDLPDERIVASGPDENFWLQGGGIDGKEPSRKCGPNTELFFERVEKPPCSSGCRPGCRCGKFVEFANSLFIFAEVDEETGVLQLIDKPFDETVIGAERAAMILQGKASVFEIDSILPLVDRVQAYWIGSDDADTLIERAKRIISDYVRALLYLIAAGAPPPGKGGRQRIVKILVRGIVTCHRILAISAPDFLPDLIDTVIAVDGGRNPELAGARQLLLDYFASERRRFERTLERGFGQLDRLVLKGKQAPTAEQVVGLVKKHGLPLPLIENNLRQRGLQFEQQVYQDALDRWNGSHRVRQ